MNLRVIATAKLYDIASIARVNYIPTEFNNRAMISINSELSKSIQKILDRNPKCEEDRMIEELIALPSLRLKKQSIKIGVREFMRVRAKRETAKHPWVGNGIDNYGLDKPKKKVKNQSFLEQIEFIDDPESYRFECVGGLQSTITEIFSQVILPIVQRKFFKELNIPKIKGFLLGGPTGCGKTLLSMCILSHLKNEHQLNCYYLNSSCFVSGGDSEEKIRKVFECLNAKQPSIIVFDDLEQLSQKELLKKMQGCPMKTLLSELDKCRHQDVYFVGTTCCPEKIDVAAKKVYRFEKSINVDYSGDSARFQILNLMLSKVKNNLDESQIKDIVDCTPGFMGADLEILLRESGLQCLKEHQTEQQVHLSYRHLKYALRNVQPVLKKQGFTDIPKTTLHDIGGLKELKKQLEREIIIPIRKKSEFRQMNFELESGGVLLYGPPGCGKTMLAKAIANAVRANFIIVKGPQLLNKYVGESEQAVRQVFGKAQRAAPCVIFFDEFDALAPKRSSQGNQVTERVVNTLLTALDGVEERKMVFVIAATNRKDMIDEAVLRSGRIQKHLYVPQPDASERHDILKAMTKDLTLTPEVDLDAIAKAAEGLSGADLRFLLKEAVVSAVVADRKSISMSDLSLSLEELLRTHKTQGTDAQASLMEKQQEQIVFKECSVPKSKLLPQELLNKNENENVHPSDIIGQFREFLMRKAIRHSQHPKSSS